ncbi:hypothetical protein GQ53DRAFT_815693 [Thozetella sp. PMI_491]|nr:hypothetical protein GQ53DRAFT_815693 [Thozetella sp. PMI_491]
MVFLGWYSVQTPLTSLVLIAAPRVAQAKTITISNDPQYSSLRSCAKNCVWHVGAVDDLVASGLGCAAPWCTIGPAGPDISSAVALYDSYCESNGFDVTAAASPTSSTPGAANTGGTATGAQRTGSSQPTATTANPDQTAGLATSQSSPASGLSGPALIGIIVSVVCSVIGLLFGIAFIIFKYNKQKKREQKQRTHEGWTYAPPGNEEYGLRPFPAG